MGTIHRLAGPALVACAVAGCATIWQRPLSGEVHLAPAIEGVAADGQSMRLADYRGKVVLLSFWNGH